MAGGGGRSALSSCAMALFPRVRPLALPLLLFAAALPALGQSTPPTPATEAAPTVAIDKTPWLYKGSDIAHDPEWRFGTLPNGLRYAVRKTDARHTECKQQSEKKRAFRGDGVSPPKHRQ